MGRTETRSRPEREIALRTLVPGSAVAAAALVVGYLANGAGAALSALLGVVVIVATFVAWVLAMGWARAVSPGLGQAVVLGGWLVRLGIFGGAIAALRLAGWFDPAAFVIAGL